MHTPSPAEEPAAFDPAAIEGHVRNLGMAAVLRVSDLFVEVVSTASGIAGREPADWPAIADSAHKIVASAGYFGFTGLSMQARALCTARHDHARMAELRPAYRQALAQALATVEQVRHCLNAPGCGCATCRAFPSIAGACAP